MKLRLPALPKLKHPVDVTAALTALAGLAGTSALLGLQQPLDSLAPGYGTKTVGILTALSYTASILIRVVGNPTAPGAAVVSDAITGAPAVVPAGPIGASPAVGAALAAAISSVEYGHAEKPLAVVERAAEAAAAAEAEHALGIGIAPLSAEAAHALGLGIAPPSHPAPPPPVKE